MAKTFGQVVTRLRLAAGLSQRQLARKLGKTQGAISHIESGRSSRVRTPAVAARMAQVLGVHRKYFDPFFAAKPPK